MKKRLVAIMMTMVMALGLLTGCGTASSDSGDDSSSTGDSGNASSSSKEVEATSEYAEFVSKNLEGKGLKEDGSAFKIGQIHANLESEYVIYLSQYAKFLFEQAGCDVTLVNAEMNAEKEDSTIEDFIESGVDLVVIDAIDSNGSTAAVKKLNDAGIPVIFTIRTVENAQYAMFVSTSDNVNTGEKCMQYLADAAKGEAVDIASVEGYMGASDAYQREEGYENVLAKNSNITYSPTDCEWSSTNAEAAITDALTVNPDLWGVASHSAAMTSGVFSALRQASKDIKTGEEGHIYWTSIDGAAVDLDMIRQGYMDASVDQSPLTNAVTIVKGALDYILQSNEVPVKDIDVETTLITPDNVNDSGWWGDYDIDQTESGIFWDGTESAWDGAAFE